MVISCIICGSANYCNLFRSRADIHSRSVSFYVRLSLSASSLYVLSN